MWKMILFMNCIFFIENLFLLIKAVRKWTKLLSAQSASTSTKEIFQLRRSLPLKFRKHFTKVIFFLLILSSLNLSNLIHYTSGPHIIQLDLDLRSISNFLSVKKIIFIRGNTNLVWVMAQSSNVSNLLIYFPTKIYSLNTNVVAGTQPFHQSLSSKAGYK